MVIRPWLNLPTGGHGHVICIGNLGMSFFSRKYSRSLHIDTPIFIFAYKQVSERYGDHEWCRITNAFIVCDLLWKVQKSQAANREGSFKWYNLAYSFHCKIYSYHKDNMSIALLAVCVRVQWHSSLFTSGGYKYSGVQNPNTIWYWVI